MPRLFAVFRTFDRVWSCQTYTRELSPFEVDTSSGPVKLLFQVDQIVENGSQLYELASHPNSSPSPALYCAPYPRSAPRVVPSCPNHPPTIPPPPQEHTHSRSVRRFSLPGPGIEEVSKPKPNLTKSNTVIYFVLPASRCTVLADAHLIGTFVREYSRSKTFRRRLMAYLRRQGGFRNCVPEYELWSEEERAAWDNYLCVPYMLDFVAVWPEQRRDPAWELRILQLVHHHMSLDEGFAWLSTLGGAHSSLGEAFLHHAKLAGQISKHQLRVAVLLGNRHLIARCAIFYAWSLMQQGKLRSCKRCILASWRFCLQAKEQVLENMCRAAWNRRTYRKCLRRLASSPSSPSGVKEGVIGHRRPCHRPSSPGMAVGTAVVSVY